MPINDSDFRAAKSILATAGCTAACQSDSAESQTQSHPDTVGFELVQACMQEFREQDHGRRDLFGSFSITKQHYDSISQAKKKLGLR